MDFAVTSPQELGIVGFVLILFYFLVKGGYQVFIKSLENQAKETEGSQQNLASQQQVTQAALTLASSGITEISHTNKTLAKLMENFDSKLARIEQNTSAFPAHLTTTKTEISDHVNTAILRMETPLTVLLGAVNEILPLIKEMHKYYQADKLALEKNLALARRVKETPESHEGKPQEPGENAAPAVGDSAEVVSK